ncbi:MAG: cytochrome c maturation protein CcmE [Acidimicrobiia bacterium]|nr:cytochrome c maturation protein CcmE [Acidimicrobiia bacterium]
MSGVERRVAEAVAHRKFILFGIGGVVALVVALTVVGLNSNLTYYLYPTEAHDQRSDFPDGERFRLAGLVVEGSIVDVPRGKSFQVTDGGAIVEVVLTGTPPPLFADGVPVLLEGSWRGGEFMADEAIIRHSENYEIPDEGNYPDE